MASNPSYQNNDVQLAGQNRVNDPNISRHIRSNPFNRDYPHITTCRYGDITPFYVDDVTAKETVPLSSQHEVRTPTMLSPFFGDIVMKKAYMEVPLRAIYPLNYDLMVAPPVEGDDIPDMNTAYLAPYFFQQLFAFTDYVGSVNQFIRCIFLLERFFSRASLFDRLGFHLSSCWRWKADVVPFYFADYYDSFDLFFEDFVDIYLSGNHEYYFRLYDYETSRHIVPATVDPINGYSLKYMIELYRENPMRYLAEIWNSGEEIIELSILNEILACISWDVPNHINIERIIAYQMACIEFATDDHIDNIYNVDLWRNMMRSFATGFIGTFELNGVEYSYDTFSSPVFNALVSSSIWEPDDFWSDGHNQLSFLWNVFSIRKSLRFEDYFVGGRLRPLAMGDVTAPVVNGEVNAYEITRSQVYQRFLNSVNISGPEFDKYNKEVLENTPPPRADVPKFLGMTRSIVHGYEVENTSSDEQGKLVTNIHSQDERFAFDCRFDHEAVVLGVVMFEARRLYSKTGERQFYVKDRYDRPNARLQYLGDQDISLAELRVDSDLAEPFAYGVRNGEWKQRVGVVSGGVVDFLKSWAMVTDVDNSYDAEDELNSDYIRSKNVEFDRFFQSINCSDAGWFHFIIKFNNRSTPIVPLDVAPNVLV